MKFAILMVVLFIGAYANYSAYERVKRITAIKKQRDILAGTLTAQDGLFINTALYLRDSSSQFTDDPVGSLIVKNDRVVGRGWNQSSVLKDPSAHGELLAVREACRSTGSSSLKGCTLYTSAPPCPMCLSLLYLTHIDKIVYQKPANDFQLRKQERLNEGIFAAFRKDGIERPIPEIELTATNQVLDKN